MNSYGFSFIAMNAQLTMMVMMIELCHTYSMNSYGFSFIAMNAQLTMMVMMMRALNNVHRVKENTGIYS